MTVLLRRLLAASGGFRGLAALMAISWGLQELTAISTERAEELDALEEKRVEASAALERERAIVHSWREERLATTGMLDIVDVEVVEPDGPPA